MYFTAALLKPHKIEKRTDNSADVVAAEVSCCCHWHFARWLKKLWRANERTFKAIN